MNDDDPTPDDADNWVRLPGDDDTDRVDVVDDSPGDGRSAGDDAEPDEAAKPNGWLTTMLAHPTRVVLSAVVIGAIVAGGIALAMGVFNDSGSVGGTDIGENERIAQNAFTKSVTGDCLDWPAGDPGNPSKVGCDQKHRFEVAGPLDTAVLPGSEFGESAVWPGTERFAAIRDEQCPVVVDQYLDGRLDPQGRFSVGMMYPSQVQWDKGARELRCGVQQTGKDGAPDQFVGRVGEQDQSFQWPAGTCIGIDRATRKPTGTTVNCTEAHAFQTTGTVSLAPRFGDRLSGKPWPAAQEQNDYLQSICPVQANRFLGGKNKLDATTLNVQWSVLSEPSWLAGSRTVVCYLGLPDAGGFATLVGDARSTLLINGKLPVPPPQAPPGRALPTPVPCRPAWSPIRSRRRRRPGELMPIQMSDDEFDGLVSDALDTIPSELTDNMSNVVILVEAHNAEAPTVLGLYHGVALTMRDHEYGGFLPDTITIYREPILAMCRDRDEVVREVAVTVIHEIAHHFGIDDAWLHANGWG